MRKISAGRVVARERFALPDRAKRDTVRRPASRQLAEKAAKLFNMMK
jgi:hypothetical protein